MLGAVHWVCQSARSDGLILRYRSRNRPNGSTQTFRRTSSNVNREPAQATASTSNAGLYVPPHMSSTYSATLRNGVDGESRYSKEQLLGIYQDQQAAGVLDKDLGSLVLGAWNPLTVQNGGSNSWSKSEGKDTSSGPEICWDHSPGRQPFGLTEMDENEKTVGVTFYNTSRGS